MLLVLIFVYLPGTIAIDAGSSLLVKTSGDFMQSEWLWTSWLVCLFAVTLIAMILAFWKSNNYALIEEFRFPFGVFTQSANCRSVWEESVSFGWHLAHKLWNGGIYAFLFSAVSPTTSSATGRIGHQYQGNDCSI
ncbi:hypothetical protein [Cyclobacterium sp. SYSU L10401]|uniref:hypothetical protein n=1 Tax=Cyclobacterium sp. SYSU L10401 TaxID=2678657 RepID=UPI0013D6B600|nr:hypothetical protein [Cyclobacterium sp. SYSU L10401]